MKITLDRSIFTAALLLAIVGFVLLLSGWSVAPPLETPANQFHPVTSDYRIFS